MNETKWKKEVSAGGVVYKKENGRIFVLLIKPSRSTANKDKKWTFPKGLVGDHGKESLQEVALREVNEEAGVVGEIVSDLGEVKYFYKWEGKNIFKIVHWYLMEYVSGSPDEHDHEVEEAKWFELSEADQIISYKTDKEIFRKAKEKISP